MANIRQMPSGAWRCVVRIAGHPQVYRTFKTRKEAESFGKFTERDLRNGKQAQSSESIPRLIEMFRDIRDSGDRPVRKSSNENYMLKHLAEGLSDYTPETLSTDAIVDFCRARRGDGAGGYTVYMELSKLSTVLAMCSIKMQRPLPDAFKLAKPMLVYAGLIEESAKERDRRPTDAELEAVLHKLHPRMQDIVRFAIATCMRREEITRIRWSDVDAKRRCITIRDRKHPRKKTGNDQTIPLVDATGIDAWEILQRQPRGDLIFPVSPESISDSFLLACRASDVENLHFHDLRHEGISRLFEAGWDIQHVSVVSGHSDWRQLKRYTQIRPEHLHDIDLGTEQRRERPRTASRHPNK